MACESNAAQKPVFEPAKPPVGREIDLKDLQDHLQTAIVVEMSTIPLYLYAYYSIKNNGAGAQARQAISEVFQEEMLHLALASNTLYSVGKSPTLYSQATVPVFPSNILYTKIQMNLRDGRQDNIQTFVDIEAPAPSTIFALAPEQDILPDYKSIGDFYDAIKQQLAMFQSSIKQGTNQISPDDGIWFTPDLVVVSNLESANKAMDTIIVQGEGADAGSHHSIFLKLKTQAQQWEFYPVVQNPQTETTYKDKLFYEASRTLDASYCFLLLNIERLYQVSGDSRTACTNNILTIMTSILSPLASFLIGEPFDASTVAAPCFNYYALNPQDPLSSVRAEITAAIAKYAAQPSKQQALQSIQSTINGLSALRPARPERVISGCLLRNLFTVIG